VHLAFRDLVWEQLKVAFKPESASLAKLPLQALSEFSADLQRRGAVTLPFEVPETAKVASRLRNTDPFKVDLLQKYAGEIESLEHRFRTYKSASNRVASRIEIQDWLMQFSHDDIPLAVRALAGINFWDRAALADALLTGIEGLGMASIPAIQVFGLGGSTTSAHHLSYLWNDIREKLRPRITVLNSLNEINVDVPLILFDDNVGSGRQSATVFLQWFGVDKADWQVDEYHVSRLEDAVLDKLRATDVSISYITGRRTGLMNVIDTATSLLKSKVGGAITIPTDLSCFRAAARVWATQDDANRARTLFEESGRRSLQDRSAEKSAEWIEERTLGYGNAGGLTAFFYNTPTTTLTALWKDCPASNSTWKALFPRRTRPGTKDAKDSKVQ
jgi:hypothetical protein